jgi:hypothetical protein
LVTPAKGREGGTLIEALSLLKTPTAQLAVNGGSQHPDKRRAELGSRPSLLPTPNSSDGKGPGQMPGRRSPRNGRPRPAADADLPTAVALLSTPALLKTPTAQLAVNGGSQHPDKRLAGGHGPTLADQVEHLLLPTPAACDFKSGKSNIMDRNARPLSEVAETGLACFSDFAVIDWGKYARAVLRWQQVLGRMVPPPLAPGKSGVGRLSPVFVEWMMGLPEGHVTAVPGLTRTDFLKILGNGVVPQQAALAIAVLWERVSGR